MHSVKQFKNHSATWRLILLLTLFRVRNGKYNAKFYQHHPAICRIELLSVICCFEANLMNIDV